MDSVMNSIINYIESHSVIFIIIGSLVCFIFYSMIAVFLNNLHNREHGKTTILAWIPIFNIFLLGKLAIHWIVGILMAILFVFGIIITFNISGLETIHNLLPKEYVLPYQIGYGIIILILFIVAKIKLKRIIRSGTGKDELSKFVSKDFDNKDPAIVGNIEQVKEVTETIKDNYSYNHTSLSSLNNSTNNKEKNPQ